MSPSERIDEQLAALGDWRGAMVAEIRALILAADPAITEDWKWNTGVWVKGRPICAVGAFKDHVKINFFKGASLPDPDGLFNGGLNAKLSRSIDVYEGGSVDARAFQNLVRTAGA